jgi:hypothetical protein
MANPKASSIRLPRAVVNIGLALQLVLCLFPPMTSRLTPEPGAIAVVRTEHAFLFGRIQFRLTGLTQVQRTSTT